MPRRSGRARSEGTAVRLVKVPSASLGKSALLSMGPSRSRDAVPHRRVLWPRQHGSALRAQAAEAEVVGKEALEGNHLCRSQVVPAASYAALPNNCTKTRWPSR